MKMFLKWEKLNLSNKNNGSATAIANLANTLTLVFIMYDLHQNLITSFLCRWSSGFNERKLFIQWTVMAEVYVGETKKAIQVCILLDLQTDQWYTSVISPM